ncbi:MAG: glycosyltransferase [bacterium]|nr:glycosyltransferase [bacterium]
MKSILVKIGKTLTILKNEGIFQGGKRFLKIGWQYLKMMKPVKAGDILFIAGGAGGASAIYRVHNQAEELSLHGFNCQIINQDNPWILSDVAKFKIFIFQRVLVTERIAEFIEKIKEVGKEIIFEADDLTFDPKYFRDIDFLRNMNKLEKELYKNGLSAEIVNDSYVKNCVTTTSYLAQILKEKNKQVFISKNKISNSELELCENIIKNKKKIKDSWIRLAYLSGTPSHDKDFATIIPELKKIMEKYSQVRLYLLGSLEIGKTLSEFQDRIDKFKHVDRKKYFENIYKFVDINLSPLEINNPFCEAKSEIRFTGTGILEIPTVAVRNQTFSEAISDGVDGFLAGNANEWVEKISQLIENEKLRQAMGQKAREKVLRDYTNKNSHNEEYYNYLRSKL